MSPLFKRSINEQIAGKTGDGQKSRKRTRESQNIDRTNKGCQHSEDEAAAALANKVDKTANDPNPMVEIIADVADFVGGIIPTNQDDFLGAFALRVRNQSGVVSISEAVPPGADIAREQADNQADDVSDIADWPHHSRHAQKQPRHQNQHIRATDE